MLSVVLLSLSAAFAADDADADVIAIEDNTEEIAIDNVDNDNIAVEEDSSIVEADEPPVVTKDTFKNYFDENGTLYNNVTADELKFEGNISDVGVDTIKLNRTVKISGDAVLTNISIDVKAKDVVISGITLNQNKGSAAITVFNASDVVIENTKINFNVNAGSNGFAINAELADNLRLLNNVITYAGAITAEEVNNVIRVSSSNNIAVSGNKVKAKLVSSVVPWFEVPAGSGNWVSTPISEGIVITDSENVTFDGNDVNVTYGDVVGGYDTIYSVDFKNSANAVISNNNISSTGNTYIYGIIITGDNFTIDSNNITSVGNYYANGIDIEGPATGVVKNNNIDVKSPVSAYAIYSGMNGANVTAKYINNNLSGKSYNIFGMSLGDVESTVEKNFINLEGNYTTGIAYRGSKLEADNNRIVLLSSEIGNQTIWEGFGVEAVGIKVIMGNATISNNVISTSGKGIHISGNQSDVDVMGNFINVVGNTDENAFAIYVNDAGSVVVRANSVDYQGTTNGTGINNAVFIYGTDNAVIIANKFDLDLVSARVTWLEIPAGTDNWVSFPVSEGIVVEESNGVKFVENNVNVNFTDVVGSSDTIYSVDFKNSVNAVISNNNISSTGNTYIYGVLISGDNFTISSNNITSVGNYYANGIDVEGPATGVIKDNTIVANAGNLSYPIYSGMNGKPVTVEITNNDLKGNAYLVYGIECAGEKVTIENNNITVEGNHTIGIGSKADQTAISGNTIVSNASNEGNLTVWEEMGTNTEGILIKSGDSIIANNKVNTTGDQAVNTGDNPAIVSDNNLTAKNTTGKNATKGSAVVESKLNVTVVGSDVTKVYGDKDQYVVKVSDQNGKPVVGKVVSIALNNQTLQATTDSEGVAKFDIDLTAGKYPVEAIFDGTVVYNANTTKNTIIVSQKPSAFTASDVSMFVSVAKSGYNYKIVLKDNSGNVLANQSVTVTFNGKTSTLNTNANGEVTYKIVATKAANYKLTVKFAGDDKYAAATKTATIKVTKQATKLTAKKKTFKAKVKTKKYTVTLKDSKKKAIKNVKVTLKIKGKKYTAKTNAKGKATFKIKKLTKKGTYKAKVNFAGNALYKASSKTVKIKVKK